MKFSGVTILQGRQIFHFPIDFWMGLTTVQCYCAACDYWKVDGLMFLSALWRCWKGIWPVPIICSYLAWFPKTEPLAIRGPGFYTPDVVQPTVSKQWRITLTPNRQNQPPGLAFLDPTRDFTRGWILLTQRTSHALQFATVIDRVADPGVC